MGTIDRRAWRCTKNSLSKPVKYATDLLVLVGVPWCNVRGGQPAETPSHLCAPAHAHAHALRTQNAATSFLSGNRCNFLRSPYPEAEACPHPSPPVPTKNTCELSFLSQPPGTWADCAVRKGLKKHDGDRRRQHKGTRPTPVKKKKTVNQAKHIHWWYKDPVAVAKN